MRPPTTIDESSGSESEKNAESGGRGRRRNGGCGAALPWRRKKSISLSVASPFGITPTSEGRGLSMRLQIRPAQRKKMHWTLAGRNTLLLPVLSSVASQLSEEGGRARRGEIIAVAPSNRLVTAMTMMMLTMTLSATAEAPASNSLAHLQ